MERRYINDSHKAYSEALQEEIAEMAKHPITVEEKEAQMRRNREISNRRYMSESHRRFSEECIREVQKMLRYPKTWEEMKAQCDKIHEESGKIR